MLTIRARQDANVDVKDCQGLLFTSANGVRALAALVAERELTAWCVGNATAAAARGAGFVDVRTADGDVDGLAHLVADEADPTAGPLLHAAGSVVAGDLAGRLEAAGYSVRREQLYDAVPAEALPQDVCEALASGDVAAVLLYSPRTAEILVRLLRAAGLVGACRTVYALCMSRAVADKANDVAWASVVAASRPDQAALLEALDSCFAE